MKITLEEINKSNYEAVCELDVAADQQDYVASNMWSLVEAHYNDGHTCKAIYADSRPVGFFMWVQEAPEKISIWRFMVDQKYQNQGIGRKALLLALKKIKLIPELQEIEICYKPGNLIAKAFYSGFGFEEIGLDEDGNEERYPYRLCENY